jgi:hypothetical protein
LEVPNDYRNYPYKPSLIQVNKDSSQQRRFYFHEPPFGRTPGVPFWFDPPSL